jgi:hypothetical protein
MARMSVDEKAFQDIRFKKLAKILRITALDAVGRMLPLWNYCTENGVYEIDIGIIELLYSGLIPRSDLFEKHLIESKLIIKSEDDKLYVCGTRGRIEWLEKQRNNGRKGGRPKKNIDQETVDNNNPWVNSGLTQTEPNRNPLSLALALALTKEEEEIIISSSSSNHPYEPQNAQRVSVDYSELTKLGLAFGTTQMATILASGVEGSEIQTSINHFAHALQKRWAPKGGFASSPLNYFMGCMLGSQKQFRCG